MQSRTPLVYQGIKAHQGYQGHGTAHADQEKGKLLVHNETWKTQGVKIAAAFSPLNPFNRDINLDSMHSVQP